ncbi:hypothetical protein F4805DRAFT_145321 [Annulohypoxylon moriforme]|nr:hypothetical protein F4805DRAFT_145321 [Annulohypoxylon moriforme]
MKTPILRTKAFCNSMPATVSRQKACIACADSKRKCDKQLPECQRCMALDRDVDCLYPEPKRRRRDPFMRLHPMRNAQAEEVPPPLNNNYNNYISVDTLENNLDFGNWGSMGDLDFDASLSNIIPYIPTLPKSNKIPTPSSPSSP